MKPDARKPLDTPIKPYESDTKLTQSGLDPIAEMVAFIDAIDLDIFMLRFDNEGNPKPFSQVAYASLMSTKQSAINNLLRYGYSTIPTKQIIDLPSELPKLSIVLTDNDDNFKVV